MPQPEVVIDIGAHAGQVSKMISHTYNNAVKIRTKGRHDPCVGIRAVPIAEAMIAQGIV